MKKKPSIKKKSLKTIIGNGTKNGGAYNRSYKSPPPLPSGGQNPHFQKIQTF